MVQRFIRFSRFARFARFSLLATLLLVLGSGAAADEDLPEGPIRERHELMETIGAHARQIGAAMKHADREQIAAAAQQIEVASAKLLELFPPDSRHRNSRALGTIWTKWADFERYNENFSAAAQEVVFAAREDGDLGFAVRQLFETCKTCHESFRTPER